MLVLCVWSPAVLAQQKFDRVAQSIRDLIDEERLPSVVVAVAKNGRIVWEQGFGWADVERQVPATPHTPYSLASVSKPFTATAIMKLVEAERLVLDRSANDYLGDAKITGRDPAKATVRRILSHTAGLPPFFRIFFDGDPPPVEEIITRYAVLTNPPAIWRTVKNITDAGTYEQLLIFFSGHGVNVRFGEYWLLSDAPVNPQAAVNVDGSVTPGFRTSRSSPTAAGRLRKASRRKALTKSFALVGAGAPAGGAGATAGPAAAGPAAAAPAAVGPAAAPAVAAQPATAPASRVIRTYKRFGCAPTSSPRVLARVYGRESVGSLASAIDKAVSDPTEQAQPEISGIMFSACLENETAAASTSQTQGLSAFTYALRYALDRVGHTKPGLEVFSATAARLRELNFRQTPVLFERASLGNLKHRTFIALQSPKSAEVAAAEKSFGAGTMVDEKFFGAIIGRLAEVIPQVAPVVFDAVIGRRKGVGGFVPVAGDPATDEKFLGAILGTLAQVIPQVAPIIIEAVTTQRKQVAAAGTFGEPASVAEAGDEKFIGAVLGALASTIPHVAPMIINAVAGRRKELEAGSLLGGVAQPEADEKFFGAILGAVASVIPQVAPIIIDAVAGRRKELEGLGGTGVSSVQADEKFIGAILGTLAQVIPHVAPVIIDAVAGRRKAIGGLGAQSGAFEPDEKFLGDILRTVVRAVPYVVPRIVDAVAGRRKELVGVSAVGGAIEADEKFLGAVLGTLAQVIPHVAPVIIDAVTGRRKELGGVGGALAWAASPDRRPTKSSSAPSSAQWLS